MCGLVGVFGNLYAGHTTFFKQALIADYFRGKHSTGMASVGVGGVFIKKLALDPINFLDIKSVDDNITVQKHLIMGHNRHATMGGVNAANAHPFQHGDITLMHNGTLNNKAGLELEFSAPTFGTDSELITYLLDKHNLAEVIVALKGAFALTWWDSMDDTFGFIRNDERPMTFAISDDVVLYASESLMLEWLIDRNASLSRKDFKLVEAVVGTFYEFSYKERKVTYTTTKVELCPKPVAQPYVGNYNYHEYGGGYYSNGKWVAYSKKQQAAPVVANLEDRRKIKTQQEDNLSKFNEIERTSFSFDEQVFAYLEDIDDDKYPNSSFADIHMTLAVHPYCPVVAYHVDLSKIDPLVDPHTWAVRAPLRSASFTMDKPRLIVHNVTDSWSFMDAGSGEDNTELYNLWTAFGDKYPEPPEDDLSRSDYPSDVFAGFDGEHLSESQFVKAVGKLGCAVCCSPPDLEYEIKTEQTITFISENDHVCDDCLDIYNTQFNPQYEGAL